MPTGGFLSSAMLHVYLSIAEHNFVKYKWTDVADAHGLDKNNFYAYVSPSRY